LSKHPDGRHIRVGFLSRLDFEGVEELVDFPESGLPKVPDVDGSTLKKMGRGVLKMTVSPPNSQPINIAVAHLKSKLLTFPNGRRFPKDEDERARGAGFALLRRAAEAVALRVFTNKLVVGNKQAFILMGDMNDGPD